MTDRADDPTALLRITAVLFDFAGTLFAPRDTQEVVANAAAALGLELSEAECAELAREYLAAGVPGGPEPLVMPDHLVSLYALRDLSTENHRAVYAELLSRVTAPHPGLGEGLYEEMTTPRGWVPYADALPVIDKLNDRGIRVALISNIGFDPRAILSSHGFDELAHTCTLSYEVHAIKPDPLIFRAALRAVGDDPESTVMVGDNPSADGGANGVGIKTLILPMTAPGSSHGLELVVRLVSVGHDA